MSNEKVIAENLLQINAITLRPDQPYVWASGWKSPIYCDNRKALSFPHVRDLIKNEMSNIILERFPKGEILAGVATAGIPWGAMVADQLKLPYIYVRPKPKEHGLSNQIEGFYEKAQKVIIIEDLISTGKSSLQVCGVLKAAGLDVMGLTSIFTYNFEIAKNAFEKAAIPYYSLTNYETLLGSAIDKGIVNDLQRNTLLSWKNDPENWLK